MNNDSKHYLIIKIPYPLVVIPIVLFVTYCLIRLGDPLLDWYSHTIHQQCIHSEL